MFGLQSVFERKIKNDLLLSFFTVSSPHFTFMTHMTFASISSRIPESLSPNHVSVFDSNRNRDVPIFTQRHENDTAEIVLVHEPGIEIFMGSLHPNGALYEKPVNLRKAQKQHRTFVKILTDNGCSVYTVRQVLAMDCEDDLKSRIQLEDFAFASLTYEFSGNAEELSESDKRLLSGSYKREILSEMDVDNLVELIITQPTVTLSKSSINTALTAESHSFKPLGNLVFCRDQQIVTNNGVVMCNLNSTQRAGEIAVMKFCLEKLGLNVLGMVQGKGRLEGGDFFPFGDDMCFVGIGLRSNIEAINQLMENDWFGTRRVVVVRDDFDRSQDRMHLDCVWNVISDRLCLILDSIIGSESSRKRTVDVYIRDDHGKYLLGQSGTEFSEFLRTEGFEFITVTDAEQAAYGCNLLNLGSSNLICVNESVARKIARHELFTGKISLLDFSAIQACYGSTHCASQVLSRRRT
ncbi:hypothetical protein RCL1_005725 [Eukaryota sp. TZLM3-RCL]